MNNEQKISLSRRFRQFYFFAPKITEKNVWVHHLTQYVFEKKKKSLNAKKLINTVNNKLTEMLPINDTTLNNCVRA